MNTLSKSPSLSSSSSAFCHPHIPRPNGQKAATTKTPALPSRNQMHPKLWQAEPTHPSPTKWRQGGNRQKAHTPLTQPDASQTVASRTVTHSPDQMDTRRPPPKSPRSPHTSKSTKTAGNQMKSPWRWRSRPSGDNDRTPKGLASK